MHICSRSVLPVSCRCRRSATLLVPLGVGERTVWRWLVAGLPGGRGRPPYRLTDADRDAYAAARGNVAGAWPLRRTTGDALPPLRTFQAAVAREMLPIERATAAEGIAGQRRHTVYLRWEADYRNQCWEADHVELPILVLPPRLSHPCRLGRRSSSTRIRGC